MEWKIKLEKWNLHNLIPVFEEEEIDDEAFSKLQYTNVLEIIKKTGPRLKFWTKYSSEYKNCDSDIPSETHSTKSILSTLMCNDGDKIESNEHNNNEGNTIEEVLLNSVLDNNQHEPFYIVDLKQTNSCPLSKGTVEEYLKVGEGKAVLLFYENNNYLDEQYRNKLVNIVVTKEFEYGKFKDETDFKISTERFTELTQQILLLFPKENQDIYFIRYCKETKRKASGKLWEKLQTFKKSLRRGKLIGDKNTAAPSKDVNLKETVSEEIMAQLLYLEKYLEPIDRIKVFWANTIKARDVFLKENTEVTIKSYMDRFPILQSSTGYKFLNSDFNYFHQQSSNNLYEKWTEINEKLINIAERKNRKELKDILAYSSNLVGFFLLPHLLTTPVGKKKREIKRHTKYESADAFITFVTGAAYIKEELGSIRNKLQNEKKTLQPSVIFVGLDKANVSEAYFAIDNIIYKCESALDAVDSCFKSFTALNAKFPDASQHIWLLIQKLIYKITTPWDKNYTTVSALISDLQ